jgi:hypothetical protein
MNRVVENELITAEFNAYRALSFDELRQLVGEDSSRLKRGRDGVDYEVTTIVGWSRQQIGSVFVRVVVGNANWGSPAGCSDEYITIPPPATPNASLY